MEIGKRLKSARAKTGLTQEQVAEEIKVSRQTISNWENERSYPDILSVIRLSDLYHISLDELLKGDEEMIKHLDESTNVVKSNKKLVCAVAVNILLMILITVFNQAISGNGYLVLGSMALLTVSVCTLFYQIVKRI